MAMCWYHREVMRDRPKVYWRCTEVAGSTVFSDIAGSWRPAAITGATLEQNGPLQGLGDSVAKSALFDGVNDVAVTGENIGISGASARTVELWAKLPVPGGTGNLLRWGTASNKNTFGIKYDTSKFYFAGYGTGDLDSGFTLSADTWYHLVVTYDGTTIRTYRNGVAGATVAEATMGADGLLYIGANHAGAEFGNAYLAEVAVYDKCLTPARIKDHYAAASSSTQPWGALELCLSTTTLKKKLIDSGAVAVWPCDNIFSSVVTESVSQRSTNSSNISRGDPGMLPEYGTAFTFSTSGERDFNMAASASALNPTTTMAIGMFFLATSDTGTLVPTQSIWAKDDSGTSRMAIKIDGTAGTPTLVFKLNIGASARVLTYTIADTYSWKKYPRYVIARYDGSTMSLIQVGMNGVVTTLASASYSGAVLTSTGDIYVGQNGSNAEYATCRLQHVAYWVNDYPTDAEIITFGKSLRWDDLTLDLQGGLNFEKGNFNPSATSRVANTGTLSFQLKNFAAGVSGGLVGYYSPDHTNLRSGFGAGNMARVVLCDPALVSTQYRIPWIGKLQDIDVAPGDSGAHGVRCLATDYMNELAIANLPAVNMNAGDDGVGVGMGEAISKLINKTLQKPHDLLADTTGDSFPFGIDKGEDENDKVITEVEKVTNSELGMVYVKGGTIDSYSPLSGPVVAPGIGILTYRTRQGLQLDVTPDWTLDLDSSLFDVQVSRRKSDVYGRVVCLVTPRTVDAAATSVLYALDITQHVPTIEVGESIYIRCPYTDASDQSRARVGGRDLATITATTDYTANAAEDGSGTDLTASLTVAYAGEENEAGASSSLLKLTNGSTSKMYVRKLQLRGKRILSYAESACESPVTGTNDGSINTLVVSMPYESKITNGYQKAVFLKNANSIDRTAVRGLVIEASGGSAANNLSMAIQVEVGDLVRITEGVTGLAADDYFITGIRCSLEDNVVIRTEFAMMRREALSWILGTAGYSELGTTTWLGL